MSKMTALNASRGCMIQDEGEISSCFLRLRTFRSQGAILEPSTSGLKIESRTVSERAGLLCPSLQEALTPSSKINDLAGVDMAQKVGNI